MDAGNLPGEKVKSRSGLAGLLLLLLLGTVLMFLLFALQIGALNPFALFQGTQADRYSDPNAYPWEEGHLFINGLLDGYDMGGRRPPFRSQPKLTHRLIYKAKVYDGDEQRGEIEFAINKSGDTIAFWTGDFRIGSKRYRAVVRPPTREEKERNTFWGNTAPLKIYEDENGKDKSKLYAITSGVYHLQEVGADKSVTGAAYVTGWVDKDYNAEGELGIPSFIDGQMAILNWGPVEETEQ